MVLHEFEHSPSALRINTLWQNVFKKEEKTQNATRKTRNFSVVVKGILPYKIFLCFFPKSFISWNHKLNWLAQTWHCMDFFSWDAIFKACGVFFIFWIYHNCPGLRPRKSITFTKNHFFHFCLVFSILLRVSTMLTNFLNVCKMRFSGSRVSKFGKIHGSESGAQTNLLSRTLLVFNQMGGKRTPEQTKGLMWVSYDTKHLWCYNTSAYQWN